jgi:hypothetical protein
MGAENVKIRYYFPIIQGGHRGQAKCGSERL